MTSGRCKEVPPLSHFRMESVLVPSSPNLRVLRQTEFMIVVFVILILEFSIL